MRIAFVFLFGVVSSVHAAATQGFYVDRDACANDYTDPAVLNIFNRVRASQTRDLSFDYLAEGKDLEIQIEPLNPNLSNFKAIRVSPVEDGIKVTVLRKDGRLAENPLKLERRNAQDFYGPLFEVVSNSRHAEKDGLLIEPCTPGRCVGENEFVAALGEAGVSPPDEQKFRIKIFKAGSEEPVITFSLGDGVLARRRTLVAVAKSLANPSQKSARTSRNTICIQYGKEDICAENHNVKNQMEDLARTELDTQSPEFKRLEEQFNRLVQQVSSLTKSAVEAEGLSASPVTRPTRNRTAP